MLSVSHYIKLLISRRWTLTSGAIFGLVYGAKHLVVGKSGTLVLTILLALSGVLLLVNFVSTMTRILRNWSSKGRTAAIGQLVMYLGLIILIIGAGYSYSYDFYGRFRLTEGSSVLDADESYQDLRKGLFRPNPEYLWAIQLERVALRYSWNGEIQETAAELALYNQSESRLVAGTSGPNHPIKVGNLELHPLSLGITPGLDITDTSGNLIWQGTPKLDILDIHGQKNDTVEIPEENIQLSFSFYPAARYVKGQLVNSSLTVTNPVFVVIDSEASISRAVAVGAPPVAVGDYLVRIPTFRYWMEFEVQSQIGRNVLLVGLALIALGVLLTMTARNIGQRNVVR